MKTLKTLITLNFTVGFLLAIVFFVFADHEFAGLLVGAPLLMAFFGLAVVNFVYVFTNWKHRHWRALIPFGTYLVAVFIVNFALRLGNDIILRGTPCRPESFFTAQTKSELTKIASDLLATHQGQIKTPQPVASLQKYQLILHEIDDARGIVIFGKVRGHTWFDYVWAKNGLQKSDFPDMRINRDLGDNWYFSEW